jgi:hypothetical protein
MNKQTIKNNWMDTSSIIYSSLTIILLSLLITWGVELLMKELFRLG